MTVFAKGDRVAWHHNHGVYAPGSVLYESAAANGAILGTVVGPANEEKTWFEVELDRKASDADFASVDAGKKIVLTQDELVKVQPDAG